jgi:hypothetical protein
VTGDWLPAIAAIVGTAAGGSASYIIARRLSSGNTRTSDAKVIWDASESIRHDLTAELKAVKAELAGVRAELSRVSAELAALRTHLEKQ